LILFNKHFFLQLYQKKIMKKLILSFAALALTTLLLVSSCRKNTDRLPADTAITESTGTPRAIDADQSELSNFFEKNGPSPQQFKVNVKMDQEIRLETGSTIIIPAGAFMQNGKSITSGTVEVTVLELPDRGAMALRGVNTMVGERTLESNGNFNIEANFNGRPVDRELAPGRNIEIVTPDRLQNGEAINLFEGGAADVPNNERQQFGWVPVDVEGQDRDIKSNGGSFTFRWPTTGWCNPDWFGWSSVPGSQFTTLEVDLIGNPGPLAGYLGSGGNTFVLFVPQGRNIIIQLYTPTAKGVRSYGNDIPIGTKGRLLAYSVVGGSFYMDSKDIVVSSTNPMIESLTFAPTTEAALTAALTALSSY
jgi:hypothetical protein